MENVGRASMGKAGIRFLSWWLYWPLVNNDNPVPFDRIAEWYLSLSLVNEISLFGLEVEARDECGFRGI